jgi:ribosomal protein L37E
MASGSVMATWRTLFCTHCRRERRHFTNAHGEICSWCGNAREERRRAANRVITGMRG